MFSEQLTLTNLFDSFDQASEKKVIAEEPFSQEFDFKSIFNEYNFEEIHSKNSMAILGNSLEVLNQMKEKSINLIFADAPYGIGKNFGNDSDKWESVKDYTNWCKQWLDSCMRVLKDDGTMYFMTATQHMPYLDTYMSENYNVLCRIVWAYDSSGVQSKKRPTAPAPRAGTAPCPATVQSPCSTTS